MRHRLELKSSSPSLIVLLGIVLGSCAPQEVILPAEAPVVVAAEDSFLAQPLGLDPAVRAGTLENGLTYYIRRNTEPQGRAELRLVVDAGSTLENDDQRGLAHLLEHMAFNGTERFPGIQLQQYLERIGMRFGPDVNAYITFDETVYMLQVPTDEPELLDTGLTVLREWAGNITLLDEDIDSERGVVLEEWRMGLGAGARIRDQQLPVLLEGSRYAERLPIGDPEVIRTAPADLVRDFYRDWYRPELMAVIAVGDFDPADIEAAIRERFADLENPPGAPERVDFAVPAHDETRIAIASDPEQTTTIVQLMRKVPAPERGTVGDFREGLVDRLYSQMLNTRLREITQQPGAPFTMALATQWGFVRPLEPVGMFAAAHEGAVPRALEALLIEAARVRHHGFTPTEFDRARASLLRGMERAYEERDNRPSRVFADELAGHYLRGGAAPGIERQHELMSELLPGIALEEVQTRAAVLTADENRVVMVAAPEKDDSPLPTEEQLRDVLRAVDAIEVEPYEDSIVGEVLVAAPPPPAAIVGESIYEDDDIIEWTLENGITVVVRPTDFRNDEVVITAVRAGGTSTLSDEQFLASRHAVAAVTEGGVGEFSASGLERFLAGKSVQIRPFLQAHREGIWGSFSPGDMETALELIHLYFTEPRRDEQAFEAYKERSSSTLRNRAASPMTAFTDTLSVVLSQEHPRSLPLTSEEVEQVELDDALAVYRERFSDAAGFTFVFVGAVDPDSLAPLVEQFVATLPSDHSAVHEAVDLGIRAPEGIVERTVYRGVEPQALVALVFTGDARYDPRRYDPRVDGALFLAEKENALWERFTRNRLADALRIRLREELREDRGGVYGVGVSSSTDRLLGTYTFNISFGADPERVDELIEAVFGEIEAFQAAGPDQDVLDRVVEAGRRQQETNLRSNQHWASVLWTAYFYGDAPQDYLYGDHLRQRLTTDDLRQGARDFLEMERYVRVVLLPEAQN